MKHTRHQLPPEWIFHAIAIALLFLMPFIAYVIALLIKVMGGGYFFLLAIALTALAYEYFHTFNSK